MVLFYRIEQIDQFDYIIKVHYGGHLRKIKIMRSKLMSKIFINKCTKVTYSNCQGIICVVDGFTY